MAASPVPSRLSSFDRWSDTIPATGRGGFGNRLAGSPGGAAADTVAFGAAAEQTNTTNVVAAPASPARSGSAMMLPPWQVITAFALAPDHVQSGLWSVRGLKMANLITGLTKRRSR